MGCTSSKHDDSPAVGLCRERLAFLDATLRHRYAFAEAHVAYIHSLTSVGDSLRHFFDSSSGAPTPLSLPQQRKSDPTRDIEPSGSGSGSGNVKAEDSGHLHFHSDDDSDDDGSLSDGSPLHPDHDHDSPLHHHAGFHQTGFSAYQNPTGFNPNNYNPYSGGGGGGGGGGGYVHMNYMRKHVTPSVSYQQKPVSTERVQFGDPSSSYNNYPAHQFYAGGGYDYAGNYGNPPPPYGYSPYGGGGGGGGGFFGGTPANPPQQAPSSSKQTAVPPPPPPPSTSAWDFLNPFESIETSYPPYTPSRDSREVREEEGIPDLEEEDHFESHMDREVVKEVLHGRGHQKFVVQETIPEKGGESTKKKVVEEDDEAGPSDDGDSFHKQGRSSSSQESTPVEYEVHMVDKKVVGDVESHQGKGGGSFGSVFEVVREIQVQFERAANAGNELGKVLEVGKLRYQRKNAAYQVSSKMLRVSLPSTSRNHEVSLDGDEEVQLKSINLSATLQQLHLWEKKLFEEVKIEEKMRVQYDKKSQKWKKWEEKGAEPHKIEALRSEVRDLSTKIKIAIQIVDRISEKINKLRDEKLWPLLNELLQGLSRMWKAMLECHHSQCQAIEAIRGLDALSLPKDPNDSQLEFSLRLEHDLINWTVRFTDWVSSQKEFVKSLNNWLFRCLLPEPEVTADGIAPFSPGRAGAPPIFVICNHWNQSLERISETSEKEVIDSMRVFGMMVWHLREGHKGEMRQRMAANKDMERKVKTLEREDLRMQKSLDKRIALSSAGSETLSVSGNVVYQSDTSSKANLQAGLLRIFEALDHFTADCVKAYGELLERSEEVARGHDKAS